jgi:RNA polymerase sigma factor (sigma-70 family)
MEDTQINAHNLEQYSDTELTVAAQTNSATFDDSIDKKRELPIVGQDIISAYLKQIGKIKLLTKEQEIDLATKAQAGDNDAHCQMVEANLRLVVKLAKRHQNRGLDLIELISDGNMGLYRAVEKFDTELGFRFSTYATWWIKQAVQRGLADKQRTIRWPVHFVGLFNKYQKLSYKFMLSGTKVSDAEMADMLEISVDNLKLLQTSPNQLASLDKSFGADDSDTPLVEMISKEGAVETEFGYNHGEGAEWIEIFLAQLKKRDADVLRYRFGLGRNSMTLEEVGSIMSLTRERIRQIESNSLRKLRRWCMLKGISADDLTSMVSG